MLANYGEPGEEIPRMRVIAYHAIAEFLGKICGGLLEAHSTICSLRGRGQSLRPKQVPRSPCFYAPLHIPNSGVRSFNLA
jgi:hypothetical protein